MASQETWLFFMAGSEDSFFTGAYCIYETGSVNGDYNG